MATRHLYLARHAEPGDDGRLTARGARQAELLGRRLAGIPFDSLHHGPLPRAAATAEVLAGALGHGVPVVEHEAVGDYVPHLPAEDEVDPEHRAGVSAFLSGVTAAEAVIGAELAAEALDLLAGPEPGEDDGHHLVVTHAFTIGWLVRHALGAPPWRWIGIDHCHAGLTVLRYAAGRPPALVAFNDLEHLPEELRWTGFPIG